MKILKKAIDPKATLCFTIIPSTINLLNTFKVDWRKGYIMENIKHFIDEADFEKE